MYQGQIGKITNIEETEPKYFIQFLNGMKGKFFTNDILYKDEIEEVFVPVKKECNLSEAPINDKIFIKELNYIITNIISLKEPLGYYLQILSNIENSVGKLSDRYEKMVNSLDPVPRMNLDRLEILNDFHDRFYDLIENITELTNVDSANDEDDEEYSVYKETFNLLRVNSFNQQRRNNL
ncbi:hypothetical protein D3C74_359440 [compost metagenome]